MTGRPSERGTLRRCDRIRSSPEFRAVYRARHRAADGRIVAYARPNGSDTTRLGVSVGKRCGNAVARNRVKRLLREVFRRARREWPAGYDVVLVPLGRDYTFEEVDRRLRTLVAEAIRRAKPGAPPHENRQ